MRYVESVVSEEKLSKIMAKRLQADFVLPPVPPQIVTLHEAGYLPAQIAHRTGLSRLDVERFVKQLTPVACERYQSRYAYR